MPDTARTRVSTRILSAALIVGAVWVVYRPAVSAYFFDDDFQWLVGTWSFRPAQLIDFARMTHFYRPVIDVYFAAATPIFDGAPALFHAASIVLHAINGLLVLAFARRVSGSDAFGVLTALFFVVQPSDIDAVAWVGALAEPVGTFFGLLSLLSWLQFRRTGGVRWRVASAMAFVLALLTHESSVVFLPLLVLTDWVRGTHPRWNDIARAYLPYGLIAIAYLSIDLWINSRNYVVSDGYYALGPHVVTNALDYIVSLYVGRRDVANYAIVAVGVPFLLARGSSRVRFATCWVLLGLLPFLFFTWGNASRYLYLPSIGFSMLVAAAVESLSRLLSFRGPPRARVAIVGVLAAAIAIRFAIFAARNVKDFAARTEVYRHYGQKFRELHGPLAPHSRVQPDDRLEIDHAPEFVTAMIRWQYKDPTIEIVLPHTPVERRR